MPVLGLDALRVELQVKIKLEQTAGTAIDNRNLLCDDSGAKFVADFLED